MVFSKAIPPIEFFLYFLKCPLLCPFFFLNSVNQGEIVKASIGAASVENQAMSSIGKLS